MNNLSLTRRERWLVLLLRAGAVLLLLALVPAFMPYGWMRQVHHALGLGELADTPLLQYLTRSLSAIYAMHGALLLFVSFDVRRHRPLVRLLGLANLAFGGFMLGLDLVVGMPWFWAAAEGPVILLAGVLMLVLVPRSLSDSPRSVPS